MRKISSCEISKNGLINICKINGRMSEWMEYLHEDDHQMQLFKLNSGEKSNISLRAYIVH